MVVGGAQAVLFLHCGGSCYPFFLPLPDSQYKLLFSSSFSSYIAVQASFSASSSSISRCKLLFYSLPLSVSRCKLLLSFSSYISAKAAISELELSFHPVFMMPVPVATSRTNDWDVTEGLVIGMFHSAGACLHPGLVKKCLWQPQGGDEYTRVQKTLI